MNRSEKPKVSASARLCFGVSQHTDQRQRPNAFGSVERPNRAGRRERQRKRVEKQRASERTKERKRERQRERENRERGTERGGQEGEREGRGETDEGQSVTER